MLVSLILPESITSIGDYAFQDFNNLQDVSIIAPSAPELGQEAWPSGITIHIYPEATGYSGSNWEGVTVKKDL